MKKCPRCKLVSPEVAERCDCGYDFTSGEVLGSYLPEERGKRGVEGEIVAFTVAAIVLGVLGAFARGALGAPLGLLLAVVWAVAVGWLSVHYRQHRRRWARTALAMLTLPLGLLLFFGRFARHADR